MIRRKKELEPIKPLETLLHAEVYDSEELALESEVPSLPVPFTVEIVNKVRGNDRIRDLSYRFASGSQIVHISREDVFSFFDQDTIVIDTISDYYILKKDRTDNLLMKLLPLRESIHYFSNALLLIQTSPTYPLNMKELETVMTYFIGNLSKDAFVKYGIGTRKYLKECMRLLVACY